MKKLKNWLLPLDTKKIAIIFVAVSFLCIISLSVFNFSQPNEKGQDDIKDKIVNKIDKKEEKQKESVDKVEENKQPDQSSEEVNNGNINKDTVKEETNNKESSTNTKPESQEPEVTTLSISIQVIGMNEELLAEQVIQVEEGKTVYDALCVLATQSNLNISTNGFGPYVYVSGINDLKEREHGSSSGWVYMVNNNNIQVGAGQYTIKDKDRIVWYYVYS